ncbi:MAG: choice-of-anchor Q domain-containing protein [Caldilineaceae bacterium]
MIPLRMLCLSLVIWVALFFYPNQATHATHTLTVCANGCAYTTIQAAIDAAAPDDTIDVAAGVYREHLSLYEKRLTITGTDAQTTIISGDAVGRVLFLYANTTLTLTHVTIRDGQIMDNQGGGIYNDGQLTLVASRVVSNSAGVSGGGIANFGTLVIDHTVITDNHATLGNGGGIVNGGRLTVSASTIADNYAKIRGGGVYHSVGTLTLMNSTIAHNRADFAAGGIANFDQMTSMNSTISANTTDGAGGGLVNGGQWQMVNLTIADNLAGDGNSLYNSGTLTVTSTIMADGATGKNCTSWGIVISQGNNLESDANCGFTAPTDQSRTEPLLAPLGEYGGATATHALLPQSPALDAGHSACPPPATDQRGVTRPSGAGCDIGAFEAEQPASSSFAWPDWARTARIAGAYFAPDNSDAAIDARLDALVAQHVSVVLTDSPWGQQYAVWADDDQFIAVRDLIAKVVQKAHARGLKIVMYQTGLELLSAPERNPGLEHPEWAQVALDGTPLLFNDVSNEDTHWLETGIWDLCLALHLSGAVAGAGAGYGRHGH